tara:strand:- start:237 stop:1763 length:1527 start_codon:yes stop_codon:yes gene_type:complete
MPLTGTQTAVKVRPLELSPTYNETIVVLESPNIQSDNFKWIVNIYRGADGDDDYLLLSTIVILPNPDGFGVIDFHRHIENYITTSFFPADVDRISQRVYADGLKWSFQVTEQFENPRWRFNDNRTDLGANVAFRTDNAFDPASTYDQHPFQTGDDVSIVQDAGYTHEEYNTDSTILTYYDEFNVITDIPKEADTPINPGIMTLVGGGSRTIEQVIASATTTIYSFNGALSFQNFRNWNSDNYLMSSTSAPTTKFLMDSASEFNITLNDRVWINNYMSTTPYSVLYIETNEGTYTASQIYIPLGQHFINQNKIGAVDYGETDEVLYAVTGTLPVTKSSTTFIKVTPYDSYPGTAVGETITMNIVDDCSKYESVRFFYMDKLGSYLPLTFNKVSRTNVTNERKNYKQNYGSYDPVSDAWGYTTYDRGNTTYDLNSTEKITCTSDWLNQSGVDMVNDMINSPIVYVQDDNGEYIAITITTNSYEVKKTVNDKLRNYTLSFEFANMDSSQRG